MNLASAGLFPGIMGTVRIGGYGTHCRRDGPVAHELSRCHERNAEIQLTRSHPAATHNKSPISGTQDSSSIGLPCLRTQSSPRIFPFDFCISAFSSGKKRPIAYELIPPKVLPTEATASAVQ